MGDTPSRKDFEAVITKAVACRSCFSDITVKSKDPGKPPELIKPAIINIAQPRWVGPSYWASAPRIAIVMLNPGSGDARSDSEQDDSPDRQALSLLKSFASGVGSLSALFKHQANDMPKWGAGGFVSFYLKGLNLQLDNVAFANVAWCATSGNNYPPAMLKRCFDLHTGELLVALAPNLVLLSGSHTHSFARRLRALIPGTQVIPIFHYAHRESADAEATELQRVRELVSQAREAVT